MKLLIAPLFLALATAGCGGDTDASAEHAETTTEAGGAQFAEALEDEPCTVVTKETVASVFEVPATEIEQSSFSSSCSYEWEGDDGTQVDVTVNVNDVAEDAAGAASYFASITAGMSGEDVDQAMADINERAAERGDLDTAGEREAAEALTGAVGSDAGIQFEDVEDVGDEARLALTVGAGDLTVQTGNLVFTISAYKGPSMPLPDELTGDAIMRASKEWFGETMPQRKEAAVALARAAVAALPA